MEITEEMEKMAEEKGTRIEITSKLKLYDIPLNIPTKFRCSRNNDEYSKDISFRVKGGGKQQSK